MKSSEILELVYGCIPIDLEWTLNTEVYKSFNNNSNSKSLTLE